MSDFGITMSDVSWTTTGYLLVVSIIMSLSGYLQRRFRACSLFAAVALAVALGALVAALAPPLICCCRRGHRDARQLAGRVLDGSSAGPHRPRPRGPLPRAAGAHQA
jgi:MFS family permease